MHALQNDNRAINSIGIIGGGSAGYICALYLKKTFPDMKIAVIESSRIPVIGVGEATTPFFRDFIHRKLGISTQEFMQKAKPSLKLGVRFVWGTTRQRHFNLPFGKLDYVSAAYYTGEVNNMALASMLMAADKVPFVRNRNGLVPINLEHGYSYHVDNRKFLGFMKQKLIESGCEYVDAEIASVSKTPAGDEIEALTTTEGETHRFDLYLDCSGFRSVLLDKTLNVSRVDYSGSLLTNRAVIGTRPVEGEIKPYTIATNLKHGWLWNTPLHHEEHLGYVFSGQHCSDDEAVAELGEHCEVLQNGRVITFQPHRHTHSWKGNVIALGNAFGFIEPLLSTALHLVIRQLRAISPLIAMQVPDPSGIARYNDFTNSSWDNLKSFVAMYFKFNRQIDTPFWQRCLNDIDLSGLDDYIDFFEENGPLGPHPDHPIHRRMAQDTIYGASQHDQALVGCGFHLDRLSQWSPRVNPEWPKRFKMMQMLVGQCVGHREALNFLADNYLPFQANQEIVA